MTLVGFQFPSNGKAYPKFLSSLRPILSCLSFNSLQTGNHIQRIFHLTLWLPRQRVSIPFKRESISKEIKGIFTKTVPILVSIPFKRESISKAIVTIEVTESGYSFNSLQTGKHIQSNQQCFWGDYTIGGVSIPFKRESISKVKIVSSISLIAGFHCFNSLQTGKHIQRRHPTRCIDKGERGFNSLQTGKHIQRLPSGQGLFRYRVSIPFKRESISKVNLM